MGAVNWADELDQMREKVRERDRELNRIARAGGARPKPLQLEGKFEALALQEIHERLTALEPSGLRWALVRKFVLDACYMVSLGGPARLAFRRLQMLSWPSP